ncbi:hypothetical protein [Rhizobium leucaenae]|uniref:Uncharacterized protein n=1 Tax=Rhizobium leucaenae TaxID=29450 RepID=A0A7W6ZW53_9HYPH|nr:hypothetical protein [Rhizobium leucaenae]MBB4569233.1 hypothetical protein [Rhizobium leucaenae]
METKTTVIRGLAFDVVVIETMNRDARGILFYVAQVLLRERKTGAERLVRRTRVPGSGQHLARDVQRLGVRALDAFGS